MVTSMERPLKDQESLLECKQRDFYSVLVALTKREEERLRVKSQQRKDGLVAKNRLMDLEETRYGVDEFYHQQRW
nr:protein cdc73 like [Quercus suber]POF16002.1 protein cdc73 like [Quercus suber]